MDDKLSLLKQNLPAFYQQLSGITQANAEESMKQFVEAYNNGKISDHDFFTYFLILRKMEYLCKASKVLNEDAIKIAKKELEDKDGFGGYQYDDNTYVEVRRGIDKYNYKCVAGYKEAKQRVKTLEDLSKLAFDNNQEMVDTETGVVITPDQVTVDHYEPTIVIKNRK